MQAKHTTASILGLRSGGLLVAAAIAGGPTVAGPDLARANKTALLKARDQKMERFAMNEKKSSPIRRSVHTPSGLIAHGDTEITPDQDVSVTANANMLKEFLDALKIDQVDLVGNDSGGGIAQIFAALYPERVRSLTLTDCDTHDNWPPQAFKPFLAMAAAGGLRGTLEAMLADKNAYRSAQALGPAYEHPDRVSDDTIETYLRPFVRNEQHTRDLQRFLAAFDNKHTLHIEDRLKTLKAPTLIVWGTDDVYFDVKWSHWLAENIPGTRRRVEFKDARIFFPEERWEEFDKELRAHWQTAKVAAR